MNDLEMVRANLLGIRAQTDAAIRQVSELIDRINSEGEQEERQPPRTFGQSKPEK